jgi:hypothetical protein
MDAEPARLIIEALKEEKIDLYVTLPEEPTVFVPRLIEKDYFGDSPDLEFIAVQSNAHAMIPLNYPTSTGFVPTAQ